ncbi:MAG TPA: hypothetical protein DIW26_05100, partial [Ruminococcus sp.]|nr:hypothetical protein [Ruminococcus sp.]
MDRNKKIIMISAISVLVIACIAVYVFVFGREKETAPEVTVTETVAETTVPVTETEAPETTTEEPVYEYHSGLYLKAQEAHKINSDVVGWLRISGTNVDYAILQADDNDFYMNRDVNKNYS